MFLGPQFSSNKTGMTSTAWTTDCPQNWKGYRCPDCYQDSSLMGLLGHGSGLVANFLTELSNSSKGSL